MAVTSPRLSNIARPPVPIEWVGDPAEHTRKVAEAVRELQDGKIRAIGTVTLAINSATTTLTDTRIGRETVVILDATTASAAAERGGTGMFMTYKNATKGQAVINHVNSATADRTFTYVLLG